MSVFLYMLLNPQYRSFPMVSSLTLSYSSFIFSLLVNTSIPVTSMQIYTFCSDFYPEINIFCCILVISNGEMSKIQAPNKLHLWVHFVWPGQEIIQQVYSYHRAGPTGNQYAWVSTGNPLQLWVLTLTLLLIHMIVSIRKSKDSRRREAPFYWAWYTGRICSSSLTICS